MCSFHLQSLFQENWDRTNYIMNSETWTCVWSQKSETCTNMTITKHPQVLLSCFVMKLKNGQCEATKLCVTLNSKVRFLELLVGWTSSKKWFPQYEKRYVPKTNTMTGKIQEKCSYLRQNIKRWCQCTYPFFLTLISNQNTMEVSWSTKQRYKMTKIINIQK